VVGKVFFFSKQQILKSSVNEYNQIKQIEVLLQFKKAHIKATQSEKLKMTKKPNSLL